MSDKFSALLRDIENSGYEPERFGAFFVDMLPVTGAAVSTVGSVLGSETVSATDDMAARLDELQFDLREGPCWEAVRTANVVSEPDFRSQGLVRWPTFAAAIDKDLVASMFAFPLAVGDLRIGAVDLYCAQPVKLDRHETGQAMALADAIGRRVLQDALSTVIDRDEHPGPYSRRTIHQAAGIVLAQLDVNAEDALLIIQTRSFATGQRMMDIAQQVVDGTLRFTRTDAGIEAAP